MIFLNDATMIPVHGEKHGVWKDAVSWIVELAHDRTV
jgi:hypothetical protein